MIPASVRLRLELAHDPADIFFGVQRLDARHIARPPFFEVAGVFGLKDRGTLRPGAWADILVFDPAKVRDAATYLEPHQLSEGFDYVLVNGVIERDSEGFTGKLGGRVVTPDRR